MVSEGSGEPWNVLEYSKHSNVKWYLLHSGTPGSVNKVMSGRWGFMACYCCLNAPKQPQDLIHDRTTRYGHCAELCLQINVHGGGGGSTEMGL